MHEFEKSTAELAPKSRPFDDPLDNNNFDTPLPIVSEKDNVLTNPRVNLAILAVMVPLLYLFFKPTLVEFLIFFAIETCTFQILSFLDLKLFYKSFPESRYFFPFINYRAIDYSDTKNGEKIFEYMCRFPRKRCLYLMKVSLFKVIPSSVYVIAFWSGENIWLGLSKTLLICAFTFTFSLAMSYVAYHNVMTDSLSEIHKRFNWSKVFRSVSPQSEDGIWSRMDAISIGMLGTFFVLMSVLIISDRGVSIQESVFTFTYVFLSTILFIVLILKSIRKQLIVEPYRSLDRIALTENGKSMRSIPLSTNSAVATRQRNINSIFHRIESLTMERDDLENGFIEKHGLITIGENAGLFAHDSAKIVSIIEANTYLAKDCHDTHNLRNYFESIRAPLDLLHKMLRSLQNTIREEGNVVGVAYPYKAFEDLVTITKVKYFRSNQMNIEFKNEIPAALAIGIPHLKLIHFFQNLIFNSAQNFIDNKIAQPRIEIRLKAESDDEIIIEYKDNGSGLTKQKFEAVTRNRNEYSEGAIGIGLRMTRTLIEKHGGQLEIAAHELPGTCFELTFKKPAR
ncbi:MAG: hypothetical protein EOP10_02990 [Proteobacteria bacterium]|nr:MAG: hypothetical protein EOP10_02990 [Pseudomonadota bacterium]